MTSERTENEFFTKVVAILEKHKCFTFNPPTYESVLNLLDSTLKVAEKAFNKKKKKGTKMNRNLSYEDAMHGMQTGVAFEKV